MSRASDTELELSRSLPFERAGWKAERVAWPCMVLVIALALMGLFGRGPMSRAVVASDDGRIVVEAERFLRHDAPCELRVHVRDASSGVARIWLPQSYLQDVELRDIVPQPLRAQAIAEWLVFDIAMPAGNGSVECRFDVRGWGRVQLQVGASGGSDGVPERVIDCAQFIYP